MVFNVMIASPRDVAAERAAAREAVLDWTAIHSQSRRLVLLPVSWETHSAPSMGKPPQAALNAQVLTQCDLLVAVFWTRLGTPTDGYPSGTVEEIEEHIAADKPVMIYFSGAPVHPDSVDSKQYEALVAFRESCKTRALYETYDSVAEFRDKFRRHLQIKLNTGDYFGATPTAAEQPTQPAKQLPELTKEAQVLLKEGSQDDGGMILRLFSLGSSGARILTNRKEFGGGSARDAATWDGALSELEVLGLVEGHGTKGEMFRLTRKGYEVAESLAL